MQVVGEQPGATLSFETFPFLMGFPGGSDSKASANNMGDLGFIPGSGRSPGGGHSNLFQYCCLGNPLDRGACQPRVHTVAKSRTGLK